MGMSGADSRPSIFELVTAAATARGDRREELRVEIPDDKPDDEIRFAPGAFDAIFGAADDSDLQVDARTIVAAFGSAARHPSSTAYESLYRKLTEISTISVVDEVLERVPLELQGANRQAAATLARRIIREATDVEPIKMAVAILAVSGEPQDEELIRQIGQFEEITLFSLVGFANLLPEPEGAIFHLARRVHGWGRIHAVERLADTTDPQIKRWILLEGFRNTIMHEYLAYIAATTGGLLSALEKSEIEDELLLAAAQILAALIAGGPAQDIGDYAQGAAACVAFLEHANKRDAPSLPVISTVIDIKNFVQDENAQKLLREAGWSAHAMMGVRTTTAAFLQKSGARLTVEVGLTSEEKWGDFFIAAAVAPAFGIDPWPFTFARQERRIGDHWYFLMQTSDAARIDQVLSLARQQLDFAKVGSGPTDSVALGPDYEDDNALAFILQDLGRFPGQGWDLIKIGLRARSVRTRNMAINALRDWGRDAWQDDAEPELSAALRREPDDEVRNRLSDLMAGRLDD
jgi:hypothetical protein